MHKIKRNKENITYF